MDTTLYFCRVKSCQYWHKLNIGNGNYLAYLSESFLVDKAIRYDIKGKKYINTFSEYYFTDIALRNAVLDMRQQEATHIMENGFCGNAV